MLANAFRELRLHPGRFAAVLTAIALSIGFLTAVQVFVATEGDSTGKQQAIHTTNADFVVAGAFTDNDAVLSQIRAEPGVEAAEPVLNGFGTLSRDDNEGFIKITSIPADEQLRWMRTKKGTLPSADDQIALAAKTAGSLDAKVGDKVKYVVSADTTMEYTVSAIVDEPGIFMLPAYVTEAGLRRTLLEGSAIFPDWIARTSDAKAAQNAVDHLKTTLKPLVQPPAEGEPPAEPDILTAADARDQAVKEMANDFDVMRNMLLVFGAIALLVGSIIIANTFAILMTQRRRQTGLLRAIGASRRQVFNRYLAEAFVLGLVGSLLGVALGIGLAAIPSTFLTGSIRFGLSVPWAGLALTLLVGILVTMLASLVPLRRALKVAPLEALRPVESAEDERRGSVIRAIVCVLLVAAGLGVAFWGLSQSENVMLLAIVGSILFTLGVLGAAPLYVPVLLRGLGVLVGWNPTARLAATNAARNPARAGATATALMLAIGLIMTLGVGSATIKATMNSKLDEDYPVEMVVQPAPSFGNAPGDTPPAPASLPMGLADKIKGVAGVKDAAATKAYSRSVQLGGEGPYQPIAAYTPAFGAALPAQLTVGDDDIVVHPELAKLWGKQEGDRVTLSFGEAPWNVGPAPAEPQQHEFTLRLSKVAGEFTLVSEKTFTTQWPQAGEALIVGSVVDRNDAAQVIADVQRLIKSEAPGAAVSGGLFMKAMIGQMLDTMLLVLSGLLGVAALIALIGVGNTLSLSVLERTRESALLRALGLQARSLRWMLLIEALLLAAVGTLVGIGAGLFFGWLGASAVIKEMKLTGGPVFDVTWWQIIAVVVVAALAAVIASILPGRKAAKAAPVEALADVG